MLESDFSVVKVGPLRLFRALIDEIDLVDTINNNVTWDKKQCKIPPGELIAALMLGIFDGRRALYTLHEYYEDQDLELIFGRKDLIPEDFNDDCLGRALDRLADCGFTRLFGTAVLRARQVHGFTTEACHADTTSVSVYGDYDREDYPWREPLAIAYGHSKARRPDLKQFKLGLYTTSEGVPLGGEPLDGNLDDKPNLLGNDHPSQVVDAPDDARCLHPNFPSLCLRPRTCLRRLMGCIWQSDQPALAEILYDSPSSFIQFCHFGSGHSRKGRVFTLSAWGPTLSYPPPGKPNQTAP